MGYCLNLNLFLHTEKFDFIGSCEQCYMCLVVVFTIFYVYVQC